MPHYRTSDTMPKFGHVTDIRQQYLVQTDGALAHHLQDREISSHLCENRYRNQQIRVDFPLARTEQQIIEHELRRQQMIKQRQAEIDAEIAREIADLNLRESHRQRIQNSQPPPISIQDVPSTSNSYRHGPPTVDEILPDFDPVALGLSRQEIAEMRRRLEQEERDARLARQLSQGEDGPDSAIIADARYAVEAQDGELARALQEKEYHKLQRAKERAKQKARARRQQREAEQKAQQSAQNQSLLCDAYSNPRDILQDKKQSYWSSKSVESDLNYVEPFEKEHIQSKQSALQSKEVSKQWINGSSSNNNSLISQNNYRAHGSRHSIDNLDVINGNHRVPPPIPTGKKPRFPDPISIRPASHYSVDNMEVSSTQHENNNCQGFNGVERSGTMLSDVSCDTADKRLSVVSDISPEGRCKKKSKEKKKKACKIQ